MRLRLCVTTLLFLFAFPLKALGEAAGGGGGACKVKDKYALNIGEEKAIDNFWFKCHMTSNPANPEAVVTGCADDQGNFVAPGKGFKKDNDPDGLYSCFRNGKTISFTVFKRTHTCRAPYDDGKARVTSAFYSDKHYAYDCEAELGYISTRCTTNIGVEVVGKRIMKKAEPGQCWDELQGIGIGSGTGSGTASELKVRHICEPISKLPNGHSHLVKRTAVACIYKEWQVSIGFHAKVGSSILVCEKLADGGVHGRLVSKESEIGDTTKPSSATGIGSGTGSGSCISNPSNDSLSSLADTQNSAVNGSCLLKGKYRISPGQSGALANFMFKCAPNLNFPAKPKLLVTGCADDDGKPVGDGEEVSKHDDPGIFKCRRNGDAFNISIHKPTFACRNPYDDGKARVENAYYSDRDYKYECDPGHGYVPILCSTHIEVDRFGKKILLPAYAKECWEEPVGNFGQKLRSNKDLKIRRSCEALSKFANSSKQLVQGAPADAVIKTTNACIYKGHQIAVGCHATVGKETVVCENINGSVFAHVADAKTAAATKTAVCKAEPTGNCPQLAEYRGQLEFEKGQRMVEEFKFFNS